jgi:class 3 adenylate cyclase
VEGAPLPRGTVTFLFTDIEGSTDLARKLGAEYAGVRSEHRRLLRAAFTRHSGHEIDTAGDGFFVAFESAREAVAAAVDAQRALQAADTGGGLAVRVRIGLHTAEPYVDGEGYVGVGVNRASRICAVGHGGQILVSNATAGIVEDLGIVGVELRDLGEYRLKDIGDRQRLFQVVAPGLRSDFPPLNSLDARGRPAIVTLLVSDLVGWGRVMRAIGDDAAAAVTAGYHRLGHEAIRAHRGVGVEFVADSIVATFEWPPDAIHAAVELRSSLQTEPWFPHGDPPAARLGIHSGRATNPRGPQFGMVAVRSISLASTAEPGQILVSHTTEALVAGEILAVDLRDLGDRAIEGDDRPMRVFEVLQSARDSSS